MQSASIPIKIKKAKNLSKNILLAFITCLIMLALTELTLSVIGIPKYSSLPETFRRPDAIKHHGFIPNSYGKLSNEEFDTEYFINSLGLRDSEIKEKSRYRILMLGDSYTEGHGVNIEHTIPKQLERILKEKGYDTEVINAGVTSYSPILEYLYLKNEGVLLNPDMVILNLDLNDPSDDNGYEKNAIFNNDGEVVAVPGSKEAEKTLKGKIEQFFMGYNLNTGILFGRAVFKLIRAFEKPPKVEQYNVPPEFLTKTLSYIKKIDNFCSARNIKFVLVTYPHAPQISEKEWKAGQEELNLEGFLDFSSDFINTTKNFASNNNITYIDMRYKFQNAKESPLYYNRDPHMTEKGYRLVAEGIFENLSLEKELIKSIKKYEQ